MTGRELGLVSRRASMSTTCGSRHPVADGPVHRGDQRGGGHGAVRQQDLDQGAGAGGVAAGRGGRRPSRPGARR